MKTNDYQEKCKKLADLYLEASKIGQQFQLHVFPWIDIDSPPIKAYWSDTLDSPTLNSDLSGWRLKPKEAWKSKLFESCPIVLDVIDNPLNKLIVSYVKNNVYTTSFRLPTIEEAPRNVWLCPWDKKPEGFDDVRIMCRNKLNNSWDYDPDLDDYDTFELTAIMIIEDL